MAQPLEQVYPRPAFHLHFFLFFFSEGGARCPCTTTPLHAHADSKLVNNMTTLTNIILNIQYCDVSLQNM